MSRPQITTPEDITPLSSFREPPLTPPSTDKKPAVEAQHRVIALFKRKLARRYIGENDWIEYQLAKGEFDQIQASLQNNDELLKYAETKIRWVDSRACVNHG
jgi:hypothetical protein